MNIEIFSCFSQKDDRSGELTYFSKVLVNEIQLFLKLQPSLSYGTSFINLPKQELYSVLNKTSLLFAFLSPNFFADEHCRTDVEYFLSRADLSSSDSYVIPIYYLECDLLDRSFHSDYPLAEILSENFIDWRSFRSKEFTDPEIRDAVSLVAQKATAKLDIKQQKGKLVQSSPYTEQVGEVVSEIELILGEIQARVTQAKERSSFRRLFHVEVIRRVLLAAQEEIQQLTGPTSDYRQNLSLQESFVVRAGAIFEEATRVYAISVDRYSEFWVDERQRERAQRYTQRQPANTKRLFVFSGIESAHQYRNVMAAHNKQYGTVGSVFLCSSRKYYEFLRKSVDEESLIENKLHEQDFGMLVFDDERGEELYLATLSRTTLECHKLIQPQKYQTNLMKQFDLLKAELQPGEFHESGIAKWSDDFARDNNLWGAALRRIFDISDTEEQSLLHGSVYHLVFLSKQIDSQELEKLVNNVLRPRLLNLKHPASSEGLLEDLWFGTRSEAIESLSVVDGRHGGKIRTNNEFIDNYPHCLIMKLRNIESLKVYYEDLSHSDIRQQVYQLYDREISSLYEMLTSNGQLSEDQRKALYSAIEESANKIIVRADYTQENYVKYVVQTPSSPFDVA
jgi:hypothetical protein